MRIHTDTIAPHQIDRATVAAGMSGVHVEYTMHKSRARTFAYDVRLTGTSSRRPGFGKGEPDDYAATWDEWGMFFAALFELDPRMLAGGTAKRPVYAGREHFHAVTADRFRTLTAVGQHGGAGHRWQYVSQARGQMCKCGASAVRVDPAPYLSQL